MISYKGTLTAIGLATSALLSAGEASAVMIANGSELSLNGSDTFTATSVTFVNPANVGGTGGSFTELATCNGCVTMIGSLVATSTGTLYSVTEGTLMSTLSLSPPATFAFTGGAIPDLTVTGSGTLTLTGFDPTPGQYLLTTQGTLSTVTFSITSVATPTPEPASLAVLGSALVGLGALGWRRRKRA